MHNSHLLAEGDDVGIAMQERENLSQAQQLLEKLGYKGNVLQSAGERGATAPAQDVTVLEPPKKS